MFYFFPLQHIIHRFLRRRAKKEIKSCCCFFQRGPFLISCLFSSHLYISPRSFRFSSSSLKVAFPSPLYFCVLFLSPMWCPLFSCPLSFCCILPASFTCLSFLLLHPFLPCLLCLFRFCLAPRLSFLFVSSGLLPAHQSFTRSPWSHPHFLSTFFPSKQLFSTSFSSKPPKLDIESMNSCIQCLLRE